MRNPNRTSENNGHDNQISTFVANSMPEMDKQKSPIYKCTYENCSSAFCRPYRLEAHLKVHLGEKPFSCVYESCNKTYTNKAHLARHINSNHVQKQYLGNHICPICKESYSNRQNLKRHVRCLHEKPKLFLCSFCPEQFHRRHILLSHEYIHTGIMPFKCDLCSKAFIEPNQLNKHKKCHKTYDCPFCKETFTRWSQLLKHRKEHDIVLGSKCDICSKEFKRKSYLRRHIGIHENPDRRMLFTCTEENCSKVYSTRSNLVHHTNSVHRNATFDCDQCSAKLATKQKLESHYLKHWRRVIVKTLVKKGNDRRPRKDKGKVRSAIITKLCPSLTTERPPETIPMDVESDQINHKPRQ